MVSFNGIIQKIEADENSVASTDFSAVIKDFVAVKSKKAQIIVSDQCYVLQLIDYC